MRASLHQVLTEDGKLKALARSDSADDNREANEGLKCIAEAAHGSETKGSLWGYRRARFRLSRKAAKEGAFGNDEDHPLIADTLVAAEFQVTRGFDAALVGNGLFKVLTAANTQVAG